MTEIERRVKLQPQHWWQDWRWIASVAFLILALAFGGWAVSSIRTANDVQDQGPVLEQLSKIADSNNALGVQNQAAIERLEKNQAGIDELVAFVHQVEAQQSQSSNGNSAAVQALFDLKRIICKEFATTCAELGVAPG